MQLSLSHSLLLPIDGSRSRCRVKRSIWHRAARQKYRRCEKVNERFSL